MSLEDYLQTDGRFYQATVVDSFTAADGTVYEARAGVAGNGIVKVTTNPDGSKNEEALTYEQTVGVRHKDKTAAKRTRDNVAQVTLDFTKFKDAAEAAQSASGAVGYTDDDVTAGGGGIFRRDRPSYITLTDAAGNSIGTVGTRIGSTGDEVSASRKLADETVNIKSRDM